MYIVSPPYQGVSCYCILYLVFYTNEAYSVHFLIDKRNISVDEGSKASPDPVTLTYTLRSHDTTLHILIRVIIC